MIKWTYLLIFLITLPTVIIGKIDLLGGKETFSNNDNDKSDDKFYQYLADESIRRINYESDDVHHWKLDTILPSSKQVVNGLKYQLNILVIQTECKKQEDKERIALQLCSIREEAPKQECQFEVVVKEWENSQEFINKGCSIVRNHKKHRLPTDSEEIENEEQLQQIDKQAEIVFKISRHIKPKDFGVWNLFTGFMNRFEKKYDSKREILRRFRIYKRNARAAKVLQKQELGTAVYGETQFMDLTSTEFRKTYLPYTWQQPTYHVRKIDSEEIEDDEIPKSFDWREKNVVTEVKNQGACGSCWAFSVTGNIEGQWALKKGKLLSLSEQELVDCDVIDQGCNGGLPLNAYKEIIRMGGLEPEDEYPYDGHKETCHLVRKDIAVYINDSVQLPQDENKMAIWLFKNGPISIGINATPLQFYRHGISHPWKIFCSPMMLNHGVLIVGYGVEGNKPFWIIKNSWGPRWGEQGYYRLYRGKNVCGVNEMATSSIIH